MKKKLIAIVTSLAMVATMVPAVAFADGEEPAPGSPTSVDSFASAMEDFGDLTSVGNGYILSIDKALDDACQAYLDLDAADYADDDAAEATVNELTTQLKSLVTSQWTNRISQLEKLQAALDPVKATSADVDADSIAAIKTLEDTIATFYGDEQDPPDPDRSAVYEVLGDGTTSDKLGLTSVKTTADTAKAAAEKTVTDVTPVAEVVLKIAKIPAVTTSNYDDDTAIEAARTAYDRLGANKDKVGNYNALVAAETAVANYKKQVTDTIALINKIPATEPTASTIEAYQKAYTDAKAAYDALDANLRADAALTVEITNKLTTAGTNITNYNNTVAGTEKEQAVITLIQALPSAAEVKASDALQIAQAQAAYNALDGGANGDSSHISSALTGTLSDVVKALDEVIRPSRTVNSSAMATAIQSLKEEIAALPAVTAITTADKQQINAAKAKYDAVTTAFDNASPANPELGDAFEAALTNEASALTAALTQLAGLESTDNAAINEFITAVKAIDTDVLKKLENITDANSPLDKTYKDATIAARDAYNSLTEVQKAVIADTKAVAVGEGGYEDNAKVAYEKLLVAEANVVSYDKLYEVAALIKALPNAATLDVTDADVVQTVKDAQTAVEELTPGAQATLKDAGNSYLTSAQVTNYESAVEKVATAEAENAASVVIEAINQLVALPDEFTSKEAIDSIQTPLKQARAAYDDLTAEQKARVTNYSALEEYETAYDALLKQYVSALYAEAAEIDVTVELNNENAAKIAELKAYLDDKYLTTGDITGFEQTVYDALVAALQAFQSEAGALENGSLTAIEAQTYTGSAIEPAIEVTDKNGAVIDADAYTVIYSNNKDVGEATVTVAAKSGSSYTGVLSATFQINPANLQTAAKAGSIAKQTYNQKAKTPAVSVTAGDKKLVSGTDYTVKYTNNTNIGKATATITGTGNYTGTITTTFIIAPAKGKITSLKAGKKQITVSYEAQKATSGKTGYRIVYSPAKGQAKAVQTTAASKTIKSLKSGKTYKVKVRAYKTINGTKYNGTYSTVKKVKVK